MELSSLLDEPLLLSEFIVLSRSAGATLRRYNESALVAEIRELISSWSSHVKEATAVFIRTPKYGKGVFIGDDTNGGGNAPFSRTDSRLRNIPFATRRPTVKEVQCVFSKLAALYEVSYEQLLQGLPRSPKAKPKLKKSLNNKKEREPIVEVEDRLMPNEEVGARLNEVPHDSSGDEMERENDVTSRAVETVAKRKKRRRAKKTTESHGRLSINSFFCHKYRT